MGLVQRCCKTQVENLVFQSWELATKYLGFQCSDYTGNQMSFCVQVAESRCDCTPHPSLLWPFLGSHMHWFSPSDTHQLICFLPSSWILPSSVSITSSTLMALRSVYSLPSLFSHGMSLQKGFFLPVTILSGCVKPVAAAEMPCWEWVPLWLMQRTKIKSLGLCFTLIRQYNHKL